jgi:hypothetical protein
MTRKRVPEYTVRASTQRDHGVYMEKIHPFGGCRNLEAQYAAVGRALLAVEQQIFSRRNQLLFRESVAFVPVEVLDSYLEDLLDTSVVDEKLFIERERGWLTNHLVLLLGLGIALVLGYFAYTQGASESLSATLSLLLFLPLLGAWYLSPRAGLLRRMAFARVVSREVAYRRGQDGDSEQILIRKSRGLSSWLASAQTTSGSGAAKVFH